MARFDTSFDATSVEPTTAYELLPAGKYRAQIVESEIRPTRNGMGQYLWLMIDILDGEHKGRKIFDQLNLVNPNPTTVEIAQRTLSAICHATGKMHVSDSEELHLIPMTIEVKIRPPKNGYGESNAIAYYYSCICLRCLIQSFLITGYGGEYGGIGLGGICFGLACSA
jgi:hypothetical protein